MLSRLVALVVFVSANAAVKADDSFAVPSGVAKILAANARSVRFHRRFGYQVVGRQRDIGCLNGRWHDVVILQLVFDDWTM